MLNAQVVGVSELMRKNICYRSKGHVETGCEEGPKSASAYILTSLTRLINTSLCTGTVPLPGYNICVQERRQARPRQLPANISDASTRNGNREVVQL